jgi:hypothetical protein
MSDIPTFLVRPPLRCFAWVTDPTTRICGQLAQWSGRRPGDERLQFFCASHSQAGDEPIADDAVFPLVTVTLEVLFSGVSYRQAIAHAEALGQLEQLVAGAGGLINLQACRSVTGRGAPQAPIGRQRPGRPRA